MFFERFEKFDVIFREQNVADTYLQKVIDKQLDAINLSNLKLTSFPALINISTELDCLTDLNLSKNNLFNGDEVFEVRFAEIYIYFFHASTTLFVNIRHSAGFNI